MSDETYLKCSCSNCAGHIEFPSEGIGLMINCPHCGVRTLLSVPTTPPPAKPISPAAAVQTAPVAAAPRPSVQAAPSTAAANKAPDPSKSNGNRCPSCSAPMADDARICVQCGHGIKKRSSVKLPLAMAAAVVIVAVGGWFAWKQFGDRIVQMAKRSKPAESAAVTKTETEAKTEDAKPAEAKPAEPPPATEPANMTAKPKGPKALADLKLTNVKIESTKGSSLVYVVGSVRNASEHQRFGVRVEFDLFDKAGNKIATPPSSDYKQIMEPREEWAFRAIVLDPKATTAKLAKIKEDE